MSEFKRVTLRVQVTLPAPIDAHGAEALIGAVLARSFGPVLDPGVTVLEEEPIEENSAHS